MPPRVHIVSDDPDFDPELISHLRDEGFDTPYLPLLPPEKPNLTPLRHLADDLELGESYAVVAFGAAASACLDFYSDPQPHVCALIVYYPTSISSPLIKFPPSLHVLTHLAASQNFAPAFPSYNYPSVQPGFAEHDLEEYDRVAASLSWTRTLGLLRQAFKLTHTVDLERVWEEHVDLEFMTKDASATMRTMVPEPYVNHIPTLTGGIGQKDLYRFYRDDFIPCNPPSTQMRLVSRTVGVDRVVDEMVFSFEHTQPVPWMLPDVPPTGKKVSVALVAIVCIRGGKLYHEHIYWDQASVLVQLGLLDPKLVPADMREKGMRQLPVVGAESARKVLDESSEPSNLLLSSWQGKDEVETGIGMPSRPKQAAGGS
ncbi:hypothetical protein Q7P37_003329 [Cladosporium fusiforme]